MENIFNTYLPEKFHNVTPYIFSEEPERLISFLKNAFGAKEIHRSLNPANGDPANCIVCMGDSCFMISQARGEFLGMRTALYLFVDDVEAIHQNAVENGATVSFEPAYMPYGDRQSGIIDPAGN
ncbi:VOC family protein [Mucilaginibacter sp. 21P]|uniref:VOC family protein n=1 Tax=Mucilaginibacter sp. 21P TaxID=2778902 RepID=UPI001C566C7D|nr:VOC family protein [Mucilaginibacter sp. 21P]QXV66783.1 VOC family protein [Mucilaginibacter sp. 21P]